MGDPNRTVGTANIAMEATALDRPDCAQRLLTAPVFKRGHHHELSDYTVMPLIDFVCEPDIEPMEDFEVVRIHPSHQNFWENSIPEDEPLVEVRNLSSPEDIQDVKSILEHLKHNDHPHLLKPLATYHHKNMCRLIRPCADADLGKYWRDRPTPCFDKSTVLWSLKQMQGIANALSVIHEIVGLHGDVRNSIEWFKNLPGIYDEMGILQIDLGACLGHFWGFSSILGPPEGSTETSDMPISSAYDIWSLGCLCLEFITWLLMGWQGIEDFADYRESESKESPGLHTDRFWTIDRHPNGRQSKIKVKDEVIAWVGRLHQHQQCSAVMHDTLNLIMKCLFVEPEERITALRLHGTLDIIIKRGARDVEYLLKPTLLMQNPVNGPLLETEAFAVDPSRQDRPGLKINPRHITNINRWMHKCVLEHPLCQGPLEARLPSRVLDLECEGQTGIRLFEAKGARSPYICLSHCWGNSVGIEGIKTTSKNLCDYCQGIDLGSLPKTFREAVLVTRTLGIRYLWIDSLCILQDSDEDWARESSEMGRIFEGAYLVLAAAHSKDSSGGLLPTRAPLLLKKRPRKDWEGNFLPGINHPERKYPLLQRAWVYQERFLARRVLFFLENEILWECADAVNCECTQPGGNILGWHTSDSYRRLINKPFKQDDAGVRSLWIQTVKTYSPLNLTYSKDKLPALSGIAKRILIGREDEYLAGMWKSTLLADLAWRVEKPCTLRLNSWRAPTWSWASVDGLVHIPSIKKQNCCAEMIHAYCKPSGVDRTGAVLEGSLSLRGRVIRSLRSAEGIPLCSYRDKLGTRSVAHIHPDFAWPQMENSSSRDASSCCLGVGTLDNGMYEIEYFLIMRPTNKDGSTYERVGLLQTHRSQRGRDYSNQQERSEINDITRAIQESPFEVVTII